MIVPVVKYMLKTERTTLWSVSISHSSQLWRNWVISSLILLVQPHLVSDNSLGMRKPTDFSFSVIREPCISSKNTSMVKKRVKNCVLYFWYQAIWPRVSEGWIKKVSMEVPQLSIFGVNQCISIVGLSAMALATVVHLERSDTTEMFLQKLTWLISDTCHD